MTGGYVPPAVARSIRAHEYAVEKPAPGDLTALTVDDFDGLSSFDRLRLHSDNPGEYARLRDEAEAIAKAKTRR